MVKRGCLWLLKDIGQPHTLGEYLSGLLQYPKLSPFLSTSQAAFSLDTFKMKAHFCDSSAIVDV